MTDKFIKFDRTIKLDHVMTLIVALVSAGFIYASLTKTLESKADKIELIKVTADVNSNRAEIQNLRREITTSMQRIENHLVRIEQKIDGKADK